MSELPRCPQCGMAVQADWDWCHGCGWDPEGLRPGTPRTTAAAAPVAQRTGSGSPAPGESGWAPPPPPAPAARRRDSVSYKLLVGIAAAAILLVGVPILAVTLLSRTVEERFVPVDPDGNVDEAALAEQLRGDLEGVDYEDLGPVSTGVEPLDEVWVRLSPTDEAFTIELPGTPRARVATNVPNVPDGTLTTYVAEGQGRAVSVTAIPMSPVEVVAAQDDPDGLLENTATGYLLSTGHEQTGAEATEVAGRPARITSYTTEEGAAGVLVQVAGDGEVLHVDVVGGDPRDPTWERIVGSLTIT